MDASAKTDEKTEGVREQDKFLPIANISRIMKEALPQNAKISKDAKELVQQCVSDFIIFITSEASDKCQREKRKTVNGDDILWAMKSLGFEDAVVVLTTYLQKIREAEGAEKSAKNAAAERTVASTATVPTHPEMVPGAAPMGYAAYAPMAMQGVNGQPVAAVQGAQGMHQPMMMYMPVGGNGNGHVVSMPPTGQPTQPESNSTT